MDAPIFLKTNVGVYFACKASAPVNNDASGRALLDGYVLVVPGARGCDAKVTYAGGGNACTGRAFVPNMATAFVGELLVTLQKV